MFQELQESSSFFPLHSIPTSHLVTLMHFKVSFLNILILAVGSQAHEMIDQTQRLIKCFLSYDFSPFLKLPFFFLCGFQPKPPSSLPSLSEKLFLVEKKIGELFKNWEKLKFLLSKPLPAPSANQPWVANQPVRRNEARKEQDGTCQTSSALGEGDLSQLVQKQLWVFFKKLVKYKEPKGQVEGGKANLGGGVFLRKFLTVSPDFSNCMAFLSHSSKLPKSQFQSTSSNVPWDVPY